MKRRAFLGRFFSLLFFSVLQPIQSAFAASTVLNIKDFGALGDGKTDDLPAIKRAIAALTRAGSNVVLQFVGGQYRCARDAVTSEPGAIFLKGIRDCKIIFLDDAELVIDNLNAQQQGDQYSGIYLDGGIANIDLENVRVRWSTKPLQRSQGYGLYARGFPASDSPQAIKGIRLVNCAVTNAPQGGVLFSGCESISVSNFLAADTLADGLHFNACKGITVDGAHITNSGDDGVALVTYKNAVLQGGRSYYDPYALPSLGEWNNSQADIRHVVVDGGLADGMRISGALQVNVVNARFSNKQVAGIQIDSANAGSANQWAYFASRDIQLEAIRVSACPSGLLVRGQNVDISNTDDAEFQVSAKGITTGGCAAGIELYNAHCRLKLSGAICDSPIHLEGVLPGSEFSDLSVNRGEIIIRGEKSPGKTLIRDLNVAQGVCEVDQFDGVDLQGVVATNSNGPSVVFTALQHGVVRNLTITQTAASSSGALQILACVSSRLDNIRIALSNGASGNVAVEIGGGSSAGVTQDIALIGLSIDVPLPRSVNATDNYFRYQGGQWAPRNISVAGTLTTGGQSRPVSRSQ